MRVKTIATHQDRTGCIRARDQISETISLRYKQWQKQQKLKAKTTVQPEEANDNQPTRGKINIFDAADSKVL